MDCFRRFTSSAGWCLCLSFIALVPYASAQGIAWPEWGQNPQHSGNVSISGQPLQGKLSDLTFDPFVSQETAEGGGALLMHYQVPLVNGSNIYMEFKTGSYVPCNPPASGQPFPCGPDAWGNEVWNEADLQWQDGQLTQVWNFATDWKPVPNSGTSPSTRSLGGWEPLFQPVLVGQFIYIPGAGGTVYKVNQSDGSLVSQINPFTGSDPTKFVTSPLTADSVGNVYYNVIQLDVDWPWDNNAQNAWLVKITPDDTTGAVSYASLLPDAPTKCLGAFGVKDPLPWPPSPTAKPAMVVCGLQRPPLNLAPVVSNDGTTVYTASRGHFNARGSYLLALNSSDLSLQWSMSLQQLLDDGCNVLLPPNGQPGGCRTGAATGVDPTQNMPGSAILQDQASASPVVAPDGSILLGVSTAYNYDRGHLLKVSSTGQLQATYDFGWDSTPAIYPHGGSYSVVLKDNHYDNGSYCSNPTWCPRAPRGPYYVTQLDSNLVPEWKYQDATTGPGHPDGYEWCVNAPAIDTNGVVYGDNEDGNLYAIQQGGSPVQSIFMVRAINAGYTPVSIGGDGIIYAENAGHILPVGQVAATTTVISSSSQNPSVYGTAVTFTAQVTSSQGTPTGTVNFKNGAAILGQATLNSSGSASFTTSPTQLGGGNDSITAIYSGDFSHAGSTSSIFTQTVTPSPTTTSLTSQPNPSSVGQSVTLTATVAAAPGTPTGKVVFRSNGTLLGTVSLTNGTATLNTSFSQAGPFHVNAAYQSNPNYQRSSHTVLQVVH